MAAVTLTQGEIITEFGAFFKNIGQGQKDLIKMYSQADETTAIFDDVSTTDDQRVTKVTAAGGRIVQSFQKAFTPRGSAIEFKIRPINLTQFKIDELINPDEISRSWLGFLEGLPEVERKNWPIVRYIIEAHYKPQVIADFEETEIFGGVYAAPTVGSSSLVGASMNGIKKITNDNITAGRTAPLSMSSAIPPTNPADMVEWCIEFVRKIDKKTVGDVEYLNMSRENAQVFVDGMYNLNGYYVREADLLKVPKSHIKIRGKVLPSGEHILGLRSFQGSNKVIATVKKNAALIRRNGRNSDKFEMQASDRSVKLMADWWFGIGFWVPEYVYTNAADLT